MDRLRQAPADIIARSLVEGGVWDDYHPDDQSFLLREGEKVVAALHAAGWDLTEVPE